MQASPENQDAARLLAQAEGLFAKGLLEESWNICVELARREPPMPAPRRLLAEIASLRDKHQLACKFAAEAVQLDPQDPQNWTVFASQLREVGAAGDAMTAVTRALALQPRNVSALRCLGALQMEAGRWDESIATFRRGIAVAGAAVPIRCDLGLLLSDLGRWDEAVACFDEALALKPGAGRALGLKGELMLLKGDYPEGWKLLEGRFRTTSRAGFNTRLQKLGERPRWTGAEPLAGRRLLIHPEVGLGDYLMFARYIPMLQQAGAHVVAYCQPPLEKLLLSSFPGIETALIGSNPTDFELQCPIMSLPAAFGTSIDSIPSDVPYLKVDPVKAAGWSERLGPGAARRIGITWANQPRDIDRSPLRRRWADLPSVLPLFRLPFEFHVLQKEISEPDRQMLAGMPRVHLHHDAIGDLSDTAALVQLMDAVVSIDTSVAHLAGALGKQLHVMLPPACDYRWTRHAVRSPWYPTSTLQRRGRDGGWAEPVETIRNLLAASAQQGSQGA